MLKQFVLATVAGSVMVSLFATPVYVYADADKGLAIFSELEKRNDGFADITANMKMILRNKQGEVSERELRVKTLEVQGDGDKTLTIFDTPADVKGTALLTFAHKTEDDDQWLYLPAIKRVKRISSRKKSGPFMGSEFSYEDLGSQEVEKYTYNYLNDEDCGAAQQLTCFVVERFPVDKDSGYKRQVVWVDQNEYRIQKIDYYDRKNDLLKTLTFDEYNKYIEKYWRAGEMDMVNHQTGKSTDLKWTDYQFQTGLSDKDFSQNSLKRAQ